LHPIPFTVQIPKDQIDRELGQKLLAEAEGILAWAVEGARLWYENGLQKPAAVEEANQKWRAESDTLGQFIAERCVMGPECRVLSGSLYSAYQQWATASGEKRLLNTRAFSAKVIDRGIQKAHTNRGEEYRGVKLLGVSAQNQGLRMAK
jgi:putative DNA primase/helicase